MKRITIDFRDYRRDRFIDAQTTAWSNPKRAYLIHTPANLTETCRSSIRRKNENSDR